MPRFHVSVWWLALVLGGSVAALAADPSAVTAPPAVAAPLTIAVMDPLALPLSCPCVKGYAQRRYEKLAEYLQQKLGRPARVVFGADLARLVRAQAADSPLHLVIGKQSVVHFDARHLQLGIRPLCMLTGKDGLTTITGLFVVKSTDPAEKLADLQGYGLLFGPEDSDEKHAAAFAALKQAGLKRPAKIETRAGCSDAAIEVCENQGPMAGVISSYAQATLEGCGTIEKGALKVVGRTAPVPFVTVFATDAVTVADAATIRTALLAAKDDKALLTALESAKGFAAMPAEAHDAATPATPAAPAAPPVPKPSADWPGWRGAKRDGHADWLPERLPDESKTLWKTSLGNQGLAGIAVAAHCLLVADRDAPDRHDVFRCLDRQTGVELWKLEYPAVGKLDYGNSPRATPLIDGERAYLLGAFGDLHCVDLFEGRVLWKKNLVREFGAKPVTWGMCASPLLIDGKLIVNPGAADASVVALDAATGKLAWRAAGGPAAYSSFIAARFGGVTQVIGYDAIGLAAFNPATGKRLWTLLPPKRGDFNVPTPIDLGDRLLLATENNGTRLYGFDDRGAIVAQPAAAYRDLAPDSSTPVVVGRRVFGCWERLFCLDLAAGLKPRWVAEDPAYQDYCSLIAGPTRVLITSSRGELLLIDAAADQYRLISRLRIAGESTDLLSHPAVAGHRLYVRVGAELRCLALDNQ